jgi:hypothetical protein
MTDYRSSEKWLKYKERRARLEARKQAALDRSSTNTKSLGATTPNGQGSPPNARLTEPEFQAAIQLAQEYGINIKKARLSSSTSGTEGDEVVLRNCDGKIIRKLPTNMVKTLSIKSGVSSSRAIAWAKSMGYSVPIKPGNFMSAVIVGLGFLFYVIPGILALIWVWMMNDSHEKSVSTIIARWIEAGRPEPMAKGEVDEKGAKTQPLGTTEQLLEYRTLLERGLISEEEHQALRRKALGLDSNIYEDR